MKAKKCKLGARIGYARVSTADQNLTLQIDALKGVGCSKIFTDKISGAQDERTGLKKCLNYLESGDQLFVWRLDRLGRSVALLVGIEQNVFLSFRISHFW